MKRTPLERLCIFHRIRIAVTPGSRERAPRRDLATGWTVTLYYGPRILSCSFWTGATYRGEPTAADVIHTLCGYALDDPDAGIRAFLGSEYETFSKADH